MTKSSIQTLLAVPDAFRKTALAFPDKVSQALALIDAPEEAAELLDRAEVMAQFARRVRADTEVINAIQYGKLRIVAKYGELLPDGRGSHGRGRPKDAKIETAPGSVSISTHTASTYRKVAKAAGKIAEYFEEAKSSPEPLEMSTAGFVRYVNGTERAGTAAHVSLNTGCPEWYTPPEFIEAARRTMGSIDLDPASSDIAQKTVQAKRFDTLETDGLAKKWKGTVFLNPPYSSDLCPKFIDKLCEAFASSDVPQAVLLVNNATETQWFQRAAAAACVLCFPAGRIKFLDDEGRPGAPLQGQAILYFGGRVKTFIREFQPFGICYEKS